MTNNTTQNNKSSINDKHKKIDNVIEDNESNTYNKYSKNIFKKIKDIMKDVYLMSSKTIFQIHKTSTSQIKTFPNIIKNVLPNSEILICMSC